jgi:hypothetical protein
MVLPAKSDVKNTTEWAKEIDSQFNALSAGLIPPMRYGRIYVARQPKS